MGGSGGFETIPPFFTLPLGVDSLGGAPASLEGAPEDLILGICFFDLEAGDLLVVDVAFVRADLVDFVLMDLLLTLLVVPSFFFFLPLLPFEVVAAVASSRCDFERGFSRTVRLDRTTIVCHS